MRTGRFASSRTRRFDPENPKSQRVVIDRHRASVMSDVAIEDFSLAELPGDVKLNAEIDQQIGPGCQVQTSMATNAAVTTAGRPSAAAREGSRRVDWNDPAGSLGWWTSYRFRR